jgi:hypothetical protein
MKLHGVCMMKGLQKEAIPRYNAATALAFKVTK